MKNGELPIKCLENVWKWGFWTWYVPLAYGKFTFLMGYFLISQLSEAPEQNMHVMRRHAL